MAIQSKSATFIGNDGFQVDTQLWLDKYENVDLNFGVNGSKYYTYIMKFNTPIFSGESTSIEFNFDFLYRKNTSIGIRYAICSSDANRELYENKSGSITDTYQLASGNTTFTIKSSGYTENVKLTINTSKLASDTVYFLYLWAENSSSGYATIPAATLQYRPTITLNYVNTYKLTISEGTGSTILVERSQSDYGSTGILENEAILYDTDQLIISFQANAGYKLLTYTVNGSTFTSGDLYTVLSENLSGISAIEVAATAQILGLVHISNKTSFDAYMIYIRNESGWDQYTPYVYNGSEWVMYS